MVKLHSPGFGVPSHWNFYFPQMVAPVLVGISRDTSRVPLFAFGTSKGADRHGNHPRYIDQLLLWGLDPKVTPVESPYVKHPHSLAEWMAQKTSKLYIYHAVKLSSYKV